MRRTYAAFAVGILLALGTAGTAEGSCTASDTTLCLNGGRFSAQVSWKDFQSRTGVGHAIPITADTGYFWFFSQANIELVIKVLDARSVNDKYWVFFGALSNVEYTLTVTDTSNGAVKTYVNPSGQFASVGDTKAFDPASIAPTSVTERVAGTPAPLGSLDAIQRFVEEASPTAAADFAPCPGTSGMNLNGCRFHIEVSWDDGRGRTGIGHAVQLTDDTGYFWFFTETNVELMIKVLDARSVNGKFWVFFGALSNVQYSISVRDTVTGASRRYSNPSGTFASAGDTSAFRGGLSVAPVTDSGRAASANLGEPGGRVTATGADGTVFTLEVPPGALMGPETVTLTPVSRIDRFPFSGGLVAGVEIQPVGRTLRLGGTLTIQPASPPPAERALPFSYGAGGADFILYPRDPDSSALRLPVERLGGYGVGEGGPDDADDQAAREPAGPLAPYLQRYAHEVFRKILGQISPDELAARGAEIFHEAFEVFFSPLRGLEGFAEVARKEDQPCPIQERREDLDSLLSYERQRQMLGVSTERDSAELFAYLIGLLHSCQKEAFDRCVANTDPYEALWMLQLARQLQLLGDEDPYFTTFIQDGFLESCLRFEIDFESKLVEEFHQTGVETTTRIKLRSQHVPLRFNYAGNDFGRSVWEGGCSVLPEAVEIDLTAQEIEAGCVPNIQSGTGWFNAAAAWIGVQDDPTASAVKVLYDPGDVPVSATLEHCEYSPSLPYAVFDWGLDYNLFHHSERSQSYGPIPVYLASQWEQLRFGPGPSQNGEFFAKKSYERDRVELDTVVTEETWFFLKHTPGAPMPPCN